ncbi:MAG: hypothetical protein ACREOD_02600 [Candidatus Dormibacteria bacterium]
MSSFATLPAPGSHHVHRTWLHLLPCDPALVPPPPAVLAAESVLIEAGLARPDGAGAGLRPGPDWERLLSTGGQARAGVAGDAGVRIEAGVLRAYPDPGPEGFDSQPLNDYQARCARCGEVLHLFALRFPLPDPMLAQCPRCSGVGDISQLEWTPELALARMEVTLGPVLGRPSLASSPIFRALEAALRCRLREVHVSL